MSRKEKEIYMGVNYRKAAYDLITSDPFGDCFQDFKLNTRDVLKNKFGSKYGRTFEHCDSVFIYFGDLECALGFSEEEWKNSIRNIVDFFEEMIKDIPKRFEVLRSKLDSFKEALFDTNENLIHGVLPMICLPPSTETDRNPFESPTYSNPVFPESYDRDAVQSNVPVKYHSGTANDPPVAVQFDPAMCYPINTNGKRGVCLIVNIFRPNSTLDVAPAKRIFESFNYCVEYHDNISAADFEDTLEGTRGLIKKLNSDSFILIFSSHGNSDSIIFNDGAKVLREDLIMKFSDDYCPCLAGKPKLFFFQNCRGDDSFITDTKPVEGLMVDAEPSATVRAEKAKSSNQRDVLRYFASTDGNAAFRGASGTIFLQTLFEILDDPSLQLLPINDIDNVLRDRVDKKSKGSLSDDNKAGSQLTESTTTLFRKFFFVNPFTK